MAKEDNFSNGSLVTQTGTTEKSSAELKETSENAGKQHEMELQELFEQLELEEGEEVQCQTAHYGRHKPHFVFGELTSPIVLYRNLPQTSGGMTADCCSLV